MRAQKCNGLAAAATPALLSLPAAATWQERASSCDVGRLAKLDEARAKGLAEEQSGRDIGLVSALPRCCGAIGATGRATARLELPFPRPESTFDIIPM